MSALAARRAAQAKLNATAPVAVKEVSPPREPTPPPSPTPSVTSTSESEIEVEFEEPASKKRRVNKKEKKEQRKGKLSNKKGRFFAPEPVEEEPAPKSSRRKRAYSPGAPLPSDDSSGEDDGNDGSSDEEGALFSGAATPWSAVPSPGPDVVQRLSNAQLRPYTSDFQPREGMNFARLGNESLLAVLGSGPAVAVSLGEGETLAIVGTFKLVPLQHSISLLSATLHPAEDDVHSYPVFAPTCYPVPVIAPIINPDQLACSLVLQDIKLPKGFLRDASRAIFLLQENRTGIEGLTGDVVPGFNNIWAGDKGAWGLSGVHPVTANFAPVYAHSTPASWADALSSLEQSPPPDDDEDTPAERIPVVVVKGPKRSGKSSLARAALNCLLGDFSRVAWLECDLGQGEFGPGGTVGLWLLDAPVLGPPFTHPCEPVRATYLGELSPQPCPDAYMAAVHSAIQHYQFEVQYPSASLQGASTRRTDVVPLVVNTQGWTRGLGEELMRAIEVAAEPTHIFAFDERDDALDIVHSGGTRQSAQVFAVTPAPASPLQPRYSAADMRALALLSYMYAVGLNGRWDVSAPLFAQRPWTVTLGEGIKRAYLIGEGSEAVRPSDLPLALNASLVAFLEVPELEGPVYEQGSTTPEDASCLGLALVRAVRVAERTQLQLLTALPPATLARATAIVRNGALELPPAGMLDWRERVPGGGVPDEGFAGVRWEDVPFFDVAGSGAIGGDRRRFRKNLQRKNQQG